VTCSAGPAEQRIKQLNLRDNGLAGSLPATLGKLDALTHLYLYGSKLGGALPPADAFYAQMTDVKGALKVCMLLNESHTNAFACPLPAGALKHCFKSNGTAWVPLAAADCAPTPTPAPGPGGGGGGGGAVAGSICAVLLLGAGAMVLLHRRRAGQAGTAGKGDPALRAPLLAGAAGGSLNGGSARSLEEGGGAAGAKGAAHHRMGSLDTGVMKPSNLVAIEAAEALKQKGMVASPAPAPAPGKAKAKAKQPAMDGADTDPEEVAMLRELLEREEEAVVNMRQNNKEISAVVLAAEGGGAVAGKEDKKKKKKMMKEESQGKGRTQNVQWDL
jgi:hypothetical protein